MRGRRAALAAGLVALVLVAFGGTWAWFEVEIARDVFSPAALETYLEGLGPWAAVASVGLMVLHSFLPVPAEVIAIANGMLFGMAGGIALTWIGAMLGAIVAFALARWLGLPFVRRILNPRHWADLQRWTEKRGAMTLLLARLVPVISFNLINYAAGLAGVSWWTFLWTTAVGILPLTILSVVVGDRLADASWTLWTVAAGVVLVLCALGWFLRRRKAAP